MCYSWLLGTEIKILLSKINPVIKTTIFEVQPDSHCTGTQRGAQRADAKAGKGAGGENPGCKEGNLVPTKRPGAPGSGDSALRRLLGWRPWNSSGEDWTGRFEGENRKFLSTTETKAQKGDLRWITSVRGE